MEIVTDYSEVVIETSSFSLIGIITLLHTMVKRYNDIYWVQMPNITPHVCRHTYCSNMAKSGMNLKTLQHLMGHSDIALTLNVYTHIGLVDTTKELRKLEKMGNVRRKLEKWQAKPVSQKMFKAVCWKQ